MSKVPESIDERILAAAEQFAVTEYGATFFTKPTPLMWVFHIFLQIITLGKMEGFMTRFTTTVGPRYYFGSDPKPPLSRAAVIFHEARHNKQAEDDGTVKYSTLYLVSKKARAKYERGAYQISVAVKIWRGRTITKPSERMVRNFTGPAYHYMDKDEERVRAYLQEDIDEINSGVFERRCEFAGRVKRLVTDQIY